MLSLCGRYATLPPRPRRILQRFLKDSWNARQTARADTKAPFRHEIWGLLRLLARAGRSYHSGMANQVEESGYEPDHDIPGPGEDDSTAERRIAGWQRALRWVAWLTFVGVVIAHSDRQSFGAVEFLALGVAIAISIWCMAKPLGGPKVDIDQPAEVRGAFVSRTSWGLVLLGVALTVGGIGATGAIVYDLSTGRATIREVFGDMGAFVAGWTAEMVTNWSYDAHLEDTHAYALFVLVVPGLLLIWFNLVPFVKRGREFRIEPDSSISVRGPRDWHQLLEYEYSTVSADGTTIRFKSVGDETFVVVLPQARVFSRESGARLRSSVSAAFFQQRLASRGFTVDAIDKKRFGATLKGVGR